MIEQLEQPTASLDDMVEEDFPNFGLVIEKPFDPSLIRISPVPMVIGLLVSRMEQDAITLNPDFQRNFVWKVDAQSRLIESLLIRIPLPAFYMDATNEDKWLVVDGLQRLSTLKRFVVERELRLTGLEFLTQLEGKTFDDLPRNFQRRILETQVVVYKIESGTPNEVKFNIFKRINTGGEPLTYQEIRHALNQGKATKLLEQLAHSNEFKKATDNSISDKRMQAREFVLRALTFMIAPYQNYKAGDWDVFLAEQMVKINQMSQEEVDGWLQRFYRAMEAAYAIFGQKAFRKPYSWPERKQPINKALFEAWTTNLDKLDDNELELLKERKEQVNVKFKQLMYSPEFVSAISQGTGDVKKVLRRFKDIEQLTVEVLNDSNS